MTKRLCGFTLIVLLALSALAPLQFTFADDTAMLDLYYANKLNEIGVFKGTGNGYELERAPTRLEGLVMLVRLLGKVEDANNQSYPDSGFSDVPEWGKTTVNYAKANGLTNGIGNGKFGSDIKLSSQDYATFLLRALQLDNQSSWQTAELDIVRLTKVKQDEMPSGDFSRGDVARLSYLVLMSKTASGELLIDQLVRENAIDQRHAELLVANNDVNQQTDSASTVQSDNSTSSTQSDCEQTNHTDGSHDEQNNCPTNDQPADHETDEQNSCPTNDQPADDEADEQNSCPVNEQPADHETDEQNNCPTNDQPADHETDEQNSCPTNDQPVDHETDEQNSCPVNEQPADHETDEQNSCPTNDQPADEHALAGNNTFEQEVFDLVNAERQKQGLAAFKVANAEVDAYADVRAEEINTLFEHTRPNGESALSGINNACMMGENIAKGQTSPQEVVNDWLNSPGHRANILNKDFTHMAVSYKDNCWVQLFYTPFGE